MYRTKGTNFIKVRVIFINVSFIPASIKIVYSWMCVIAERIECYLAIWCDTVLY